MGVSLGLPTGEVINNSALGWITMMIQFIIIGTPITHVGMKLNVFGHSMDLDLGKQQNVKTRTITKNNCTKIEYFR